MDYKRIQKILALRPYVKKAATQRKNLRAPRCIHENRFSKPKQAEPARSKNSQAKAKAKRPIPTKLEAKFSDKEVKNSKEKSERKKVTRAPHENMAESPDTRRSQSRGQSQKSQKTPRVSFANQVNEFIGDASFGKEEASGKPNETEDPYEDLTGYQEQINERLSWMESPTELDYEVLLPAVLKD